MCTHRSFFYWKKKKSFIIVSSIDFFPAFFFLAKPLGTTWFFSMKFSATPDAAIDRPTQAARKQTKAAPFPYIFVAGVV